MAAASTNLCPSASVLEILSEPARSHRVKVPLDIAPVILSVPSTFNNSTKCDRELKQR